MQPFDNGMGSAQHLLKSLLDVINTKIAGEASKGCR
jgi:hypothetical protein